MANLKDISTVPELTALEGTEKVLLNVDGSAKQARVDLIKPAEEWDLDATINSAPGESGALEFESVLNSENTFDAIKNKILNNEQVKIRIHNVFTPPGEPPQVLHENIACSCVMYDPTVDIIVFQCPSLALMGSMACALLSNGEISVDFNRA